MNIEAPNVIHVEPVAVNDGFPLEIGLVLHNGAAYCLVTQPEAHGRPVAPEQEQATGLTAEVRSCRGLPVREVAAELNRALKGDIVYLDGDGPGEALLGRLFEAADTAPSFSVATLQSLLGTEHPHNWQRAWTLALEEQRHIRNRASDRALLLQRTCLLSLDTD